MDFGRMDNQTRPARMSVTERARVSMSALDCELGMWNKRLACPNRISSGRLQVRGSERFHGSASAGRPGGVGYGGNSGDGTVEEDSNEWGAADEDGQAADERVVAPDPALHPLLPRPRLQRPADAASVLSLQETKQNRVADLSPFFFWYEGRANGTDTRTKLESGCGGEKAPKGSRRPRRGAGAGRSVGGECGDEIMHLLSLSSSMPFAQRGRGATGEREAAAARGRRRRRRAEDAGSWRWAGCLDGPYESRTLFSTISNGPKTHTDSISGLAWPILPKMIMA